MNPISRGFAISRHSNKPHIMMVAGEWKHTGNLLDVNSKAAKIHCDKLNYPIVDNFLNVESKGK